MRQQILYEQHILLMKLTNTRESYSSTIKDLIEDNIKIF